MGDDSLFASADSEGDTFGLAFMKSRVKMRITIANIKYER
jgi:hypothetical protein